MRSQSKHAPHSTTEQPNRAASPYQHGARQAFESPRPPAGARSRCMRDNHIRESPTRDKTYSAVTVISGPSMPTKHLFFPLWFILLLFLVSPTLRLQRLTFARLEADGRRRREVGGGPRAQGPLVWRAYVSNSISSTSLSKARISRIWPKSASSWMRVRAPESCWFIWAGTVRGAGCLYGHQCRCTWAYLIRELRHSFARLDGIGLLQLQLAARAEELGRHRHSPSDHRLKRLVFGELYFAHGECVCV